MRTKEVTEYALSLPEVAEAPHFAANSFRVRGKILATVPPTGGHLHVFVDDDCRDVAVSMHSDFCENLWWGKRIVGVRVELAKADSEVVKDLLRNAWVVKAPKALEGALPPERASREVL